jgi:hypothetical protein
MRKMALLAMLFWSTLLVAAGPGCASVEPPLTFRAQAAEVHLTFTAASEHNQIVTDLSADDFNILRDGKPINHITGFENLKDAPLSLVVLADVSESMRKVMSLENFAKTYLSQTLSGESDSVSFLDFGAIVHPAGILKNSSHLTSMYDSALDVVRRERPIKSRQAVLLITDGGDNYSLHSVADVITGAQKSDTAFYVLDTDPWNQEADRDLRRLAAETGGRYYLVEKTKQISAAIQEIESELRNTYMVTFRADGSRNGIHQLTMRSSVRNLKFFYRTKYYQSGPLETASSRENFLGSNSAP